MSFLPLTLQEYINSSSSRGCGAGALRTALAFVVWLGDEWEFSLEHSAAVLAFLEPPGARHVQQDYSNSVSSFFQTLVIKVSGVILSVVGGLAVGKVTTE